MALPVHSKLTPTSRREGEVVIHRIYRGTRFLRRPRMMIACGRAARHDRPVPTDIPTRGSELLMVQGGAIGRRQRAYSGIAPDTMRSKLRSGKWQRLQRGVYASFSGQPARETMLWAALLRAGPDATLSHQTAAERHGLIDEPSAVITITVPTLRASGAAEDPRRRGAPVEHDPADQASDHVATVYSGGGHGARPHTGGADLRRRVRVDLPGHRAPAYHRRPDPPRHGRAQEDAVAERTRDRTR